MMFSACCYAFFKVVILPCKISLKMLQNAKNGIKPPNGLQSKNQKNSDLFRPKKFFCTSKIADFRQSQFFGFRRELQKVAQY